MRTTCPLSLTIVVSLSGCPSSEVPAEPERAVVIEDWCEALQGGPPGGDDPRVGFSRAVGTARFFALDADQPSVAADLVAALSQAEPGLEALDAFADPAGDRCSAEASVGSLGVVEISDLDGVAVIRPGTGDVTLGAATTAVVVDLRDLPATPDADAALERAVAAAFATDVDLGRRWDRQFSGWPMEWGNNSVYTATNVASPDTLAAAGAADLPLAFIVGPKVSPRAAQVAGVLRAQSEAWLWGYDVHTSIAESSWVGVGDGGLAVVTSPRDVSGDALPPVIPADTDVLWPEDLIASLPTAGPPAPLTLTDAATPPAPWVRGGGVPVIGTTVAHRHAMLVEAHGLLDRFYPYFDLVGRGIDDALLEELDRIAEIPAEDTVGPVHSLGRFVHALEDGHGFFGNYAVNRPTIGYVGIAGDRVADELLIRHSLDGNGLDVGDTITAVDGTPVAEWFAEVTQRYSAASEGYLWNLATRELNQISTERTLQVRAADGAVRSVQVTPQTEADYAALPFSGVLRPSGYLDGLDQPDVFFLNMSVDVLNSPDGLRDALADLQSRTATGVVVDMRSYPGVNHYEVAAYLLSGSFSSPQFVVPTWTGPDRLEWDTSSYALSGVPGAYDGRVVLLVSNHSVSAAENFSLMLTQRESTTVVGQQSASTNGNITGSYLAGQHYVMFTGMGILTPDGDPFHGIGIVPDVEVVPDAVLLAAGRDPELEAALDVLAE